MTPQQQGPGPEGQTARNRPPPKRTAMNRTPKCCHYKSLRPASVILLIAIVSGLPSAVPPCAGQTTAPVQQAADQDCASIKQEIQQLQDEIARISAEMQALTNQLDQLNTEITQDQKVWSGLRARGNLSETAIGEGLDALAKLLSLRKQLKQQLEDDASLIQAIKDEIADLLNKLANCGPPSATQPPNPPSPPQENKKVAFDFRGFGGATFVSGNTPSTAGFDGAVLFPLGNRVLVGPTAGFQWVDSSIINSFGSMTAGSTFGNESVGFKEGNFGGQIGLNLSGWELGIRGGATVASSTITQGEGFCGQTSSSSSAVTCTTTSSTTTHDTVVSPFVGGYISHSIFSHVGVFAEFDYHRQKDYNVFDLSDRAVVGGIVLSFGRHKAK
jgi:hypothetical protein